MDLEQEEEELRKKLLVYLSYFGIDGKALFQFLIDSNSIICGQTITKVLFDFPPEKDDTIDIYQQPSCISIPPNFNILNKKNSSHTRLFGHNSYKGPNFTITTVYLDKNVRLHYGQGVFRREILFGLYDVSFDKQYFTGKSFRVDNNVKAKRGYVTFGCTRNPPLHYDWYVERGFQFLNNDSDKCWIDNSNICPSEIEPMLDLREFNSDEGFYPHESFREYKCPHTNMRIGNCQREGEAEFYEAVMYLSVRNVKRLLDLHPEYANIHIHEGTLVEKLAYGRTIKCYSFSANKEKYSAILNLLLSVNPLLATEKAYKTAHFVKEMEIIQIMSLYEISNNEKRVCQVCLSYEPSQLLVNPCLCKDPIHATCYYGPVCKTCNTTITKNEVRVTRDGTLETKVFFPSFDLYFDQVMTRHPLLKCSYEDRLRKAFEWLQCDRIVQLLEEDKSLIPFFLDLMEKFEAGEQLYLVYPPKLNSDAYIDLLMLSSQYR